MPPLDLDDLAALQAELEVLDERDLIAELATSAHRTPRPVVAPVPAPVPPRLVRDAAPATDPGPATRPPLRRLPPVPAPAPADRPARRTGPLPTVSPRRDTAVDLPVADPPVADPPVVPARPVVGRPPVPGMTVVRVLPAVPRVTASSADRPADPTGRRPRHAALDPDPAPDRTPAGRGLLSWAVEPTS